MPRLGGRPALSALLPLLALALLSCTPSGSSPHATPSHSPSPYAAISPDTHLCTGQKEPPGAPGHFNYKNATFTINGCNWTLLDAGNPNAANSSVNLSGTWTYANGTITFATTSTSCSGMAGTYTWAFAGSALLFKAQSDACSARAKLLTAGVWLFQP